GPPAASDSDTRLKGPKTCGGGLWLPAHPHTPTPSPVGGGGESGGAGGGLVHGPNACEKRKGAFHEPDFGRDIALRCPRPRSSGRHRCAAERGADGAARRPYQVQGFNARNFSGKPLHEPPLSRPSATLSPLCGERAGRGVPIWFMVPMHAEKRKEAFH